MSWKPTPPPFRKFKKEVFINASHVSSFIYQTGESSSLRIQSKDVPMNAILSTDMQKKCAYLKQCLLDYRKITGYGRGMAAVQIGIRERFAVVYKNGALLIFINPRLIKQAKKLYRYPEICMSAYPVITPIVRPAWIEFSYYSEKGIQQLWQTKDTTPTGKMLNRVFQHEIDHMNGIMNLDRITSPKDLTLESNPSFYQSTKFELV